MKLSIWLAIFFVQTQGFSQIYLKGKVWDNSNQAIPYANVVVLNERIGTLSDTLGIFTLSIPKKH